MKIYNVVLLVLFTFLISCAERKPEKIGLIEEELEYTSNGTVMKGFLVYDGDIEGKRPGVIVVHEWWGHNDYARNRARMLAELGYVAFALDMFGDGKTADNPEDAGKLAGEVFGNLETSQAKFMSAYKLLQSNELTDADKIAAIGYCFGGSVVLHMAKIGTDLKAIVSFHGGLYPTAIVKPGIVKAQILVCNGAADPLVPDDQIQAFKTEMDNAGVNYKFINYDNALHSFTNPGADSTAKKFNMPLAYNEKADKESWEEMKIFLSNVFSNK
jgi:dienelactone hydrolase